MLSEIDFPSMMVAIGKVQRGYFRFFNSVSVSSSFLVLVSSLELILTRLLLRLSKDFWSLEYVFYMVCLSFTALAISS